MSVVLSACSGLFIETESLTWSLVAAPSSEQDALALPPYRDAYRAFPPLETEEYSLCGRTYTSVCLPPAVGIGAAHTFGLFFWHEHSRAGFCASGYCCFVHLAVY